MTQSLATAITATQARLVEGIAEAEAELVVARRRCRELREKGLKPWHVEGREGRHWMLLDYIDVVVHVFGEEEREYYDLERLWSDAPRPAWAAAGARSAG